MRSKITSLLEQHNIKPDESMLDDLQALLVEQAVELTWNTLQRLADEGKNKEGAPIAVKSPTPGAAQGCTQQPKLDL